MKNVFAAELGRSSDDVFSEISEEPIAAASVAQIHLARLSTGEEVVVKIQRPDARRQVTADLDIVLRLASWLGRAFLTGIVHQLVMTLIGAACALGGILLIAADSGPMLTESFRLYAFFGFTLLFFGFVLAARVLIQVFHQGGPTRNRS